MILEQPVTLGGIILAVLTLLGGVIAYLRDAQNRLKMETELHANQRKLETQAKLDQVTQNVNLRLAEINTAADVSKQLIMAMSALSGSIDRLGQVHEKSEERITGHITEAIKMSTEALQTRIQTSQTATHGDIERLQSLFASLMTSIEALTNKNATIEATVNLILDEIKLIKANQPTKPTEEK